MVSEKLTCKILVAQFMANSISPLSRLGGNAELLKLKIQSANLRDHEMEEIAENLAAIAKELWNMFEEVSMLLNEIEE